MQFIGPEAIKSRGVCVGIEKIDDKIAKALSSDVQYRVQQLIQVIKLVFTWCVSVTFSLLPY